MRRVTAFSISLCLAAGLALGSAASGQPYEPPGQLGALGGEGPPNQLLNRVWDETEGDWRGTWTPTGARRGAYHGEWRKGSERASAELTITVDRANVTVVRTQALGQCVYHGVLQPLPRRGVLRVGGSYRCDWRPGPLRWSAIIPG